MIRESIKQQIIRDRLIGQKTITDIVAQYGVSAGSVSRWTNDYLSKHTEAEVEELAVDKQSEIGRLRKQNEDLTREVEKLNAEKTALQDLLLRILDKNENAANPVKNENAANSVKNENAANP